MDWDRHGLLAHLRGLETALHSPATPHGLDRLDKLLHDAFEEVGYSGHRFDKAAVLAAFAAAEESTPIRSQDFELSLLADSVALLSYRSARVDENGNLSRHARRMSVWVRGGDAEWQLRYHQGTPTDAFESASR